MMDNQYKLILDEKSTGPSGIELFDLTNDQAESNNLATAYPDIVESMQQQMYDWQQSVLTSLTGADY